MRYMMVSKRFPAKHPRAGELTGFRERILTGRKLHTLRHSTRWLRLDGERVSLRQWAGRPYASKQVEFARCVIRPKCFVVEGETTESARVAMLARHDGFDDVADFGWWFGAGPGEPIDFRGVRVWFCEVRAVGG